MLTGAETVTAALMFTSITTNAVKMSHCCLSGKFHSYDSSDTRRGDVWSEPLKMRSEVTAGGSCFLQRQLIALVGTTT